MSRRRRFQVLAVLAALVLVLGVASMDALRGRSAERLAFELDRGDAVLHGTTYVPTGVDASNPAPAVLVAHGLGSDRDSTRSLVRRLVARGYVVVAWDARGQGESTGRVGIAAPDAEVADVSALIDQLADRDDVLRDRRDGDVRVAVVGTSYGGGTALLAAAADDRIDAVVPIFAWFDLHRALEPGGVLKLRWASELFAAGIGSERSDDPCGALERELCAAWRASAEQGAFTERARGLLAERSPASVAPKLDTPTLVVQGQMDSLFELDEAIDTARALEATNTPVRVEWVRAGHDLPLSERRRDHVEQAVVRWLERYLERHGSVDVGPRFSVELGAGRGYAHAPEVPPTATMRALELEAVDDVDDDGFVRLAVPPAGLPAEVTTLPGLGDFTAVDTGFDVPSGQRATFRATGSDEGLEVVGRPVVRLQVTADHPEVELFVRLVDVAADGRRIIPRGLVAPVRVTGVPPLGSPRGRGIGVRLPAIAWRLAPGHHFELEVASTDAGYVAPDAAGTIAVQPAGSRVLRLPLVDASDRSPDAFGAGRDWRDLVAWALLASLAAIAAALLLARTAARRDRRVQEPQLRDVPLVADGLVKRFGDGRVAVDGASFRVEPGSVVGIVGPNGAGKTTTIRMLLGLVQPSDGFAHVYGQRVRPGSPHLAHVGALVDGPGLVPHLTGREHLRRYWSVTGRPLADANLDEALAAVELQADADRVVRTWSHGMRQRLGIAQALLGRPSLVLLDEPANGLDPAQIAHLRQLVREIAGEGRSVLLSSHLLGELEQVCTHVVLMAEGRVLRAGTLADVVGEHDDLEAAFLSLVQDGGGRDA